MDDKMKQAVNLSLAEVFETMFFTILEPLDAIPASEDWPSGKDFVEAEISYSGNGIVGELRFFFPQGLARSLAANFLGEPQDKLSDAQLVDTVRETVNMGVGSMLGRIDPNGECTLGIPKARLVDDFTPDGIIADLELYVFRTAFGFLWLVYNVKSL